MLITTSELSRRTGATKRQIEYWRKIGLIVAEPNKHPRSGVPKKYDSAIVQSVKNLTRVSNAIREISLKTIMTEMDEGCIYIGDNVVLSWW
jgi:DNA-binding transcriptional MerR regulator